MSITTGNGPFSPEGPGRRHLFRDGDLVFLQDLGRRVRGRLAGHLVIDSEEAMLLHRSGALPTYHFPGRAVDFECLSEDRRRTDDRLGEILDFTVHAGGKREESAAWRYVDPPAELNFLEGVFGFDFSALDAWFEEDEHVRVHPRDPFHRIDVLRSGRHVCVFVDEEPVAESRRPMMLFETGLPVRYYLPKSDVRLELLHSSVTTTHCPYKGEATYYHVRVMDKTHTDVFWTYEEPLRDAQKVAGMLSVLQESRRVRVEVDGEPLVS